MNPNQQQRMASVIARLGRAYPEWRIGQIISNVAWWARGPAAESIWDVEDEEFLAAAEAHLAQRESQASAAISKTGPSGSIARAD